MNSKQTLYFSIVGTISFLMSRNQSVKHGFSDHKLQQIKEIKMWIMTIGGRDVPRSDTLCEMYASACK